jgi:hypothetical protein
MGNKQAAFGRTRNAFEESVRRLLEAREEQGLPVGVEDRAVVDRVATVLKAATSIEEEAAA